MPAHEIMVTIKPLNSYTKKKTKQKNETTFDL